MKHTNNTFITHPEITLLSI